MPLWYRILARAALLLAGPWYLARRGREARRVLRERRHWQQDPVGQPGALWVHAVSVGEVGVAQALVAGLPADLPVLVTTITPTGQAQARRLLGGRAALTYFPLEEAGSVRRFFDRERPRALVLCEGDYWPLVLAEARKRGLRIAAVNVRVGDRNFRRLLRHRRLVQRYLFDPVERFGVQSERDGERLRALGVPGERVRLTGNLKYDAPEPRRLEALEQKLEELAAGRPILVAGSTMQGEEPPVLRAFVESRKVTPAFLLLAPRHPERAEEVSREAERAGLRFLRRTRLEERPTDPPAGWDGLLLDTVGELASLYRLARGGFIGGTLVPTGGHNPIEPARAGIAIAVGPSLENFRDIAEAFDRAAAWQRVGSAEELARVWSEWLRDAGTARALGERARAHVQAGSGAIRRTLELLEPLLDSGRRGSLRPP